MNLGLGIDTGGTYTDAVLLDLDEGIVRRKAKALTTRHDLTVGILNALEGLGGLPVSEIRLVSVSTTLATNALVEGKGGRVCLLAIGFYDWVLENNGLGKNAPVEVRAIRGRHGTQGEEIEPLDEASLEAAVRETCERVDAYAIVAYGGVWNPVHEVRARDIVRRRTRLPVVCGHELSNQLEAGKRAVTAAFNARLLPLVRELMESLQRVLIAHNVAAPLMIVKGDGSLMSVGAALERPIETLLSGPAASAVGGRFLARRDDAVVVDMGGTTTDIAVFRGGVLKVNGEGATVGGWRTAVRAVDMRTSGVGGDSRVWVNEVGVLGVGPPRVVPLSLAAAQHPQVLEQLTQLERAATISHLIQPCEFLMQGREPNGAPLPDRDRALLDALRAGPLSLVALSKRLGLAHPRLLDTTTLEERGLIVRIGLTPTDVLHAQGVFAPWCVSAAESGLRLLARRLRTEVDDVIRRVRAAVDKRLTKEILTKFLIADAPPATRADERTCAFLVDRALQDPATCDGWKVDVRVRMPLIAIGAPVSVYFPRVASALGAELIVPQHAEVANAVGAIVGGVVETVEVIVKPIYTAAGIERYEVLAPAENQNFRRLEDAIAHAFAVAERAAAEKARHAGATNPQVTVERRDQTAAVAEGYGDPLLLGVRVRATAVGKMVSD
jgi:N-methylhydantoinase A/oxoprolinase/acetone carboxylase beta subunit